MGVFSDRFVEWNAVGFEILEFSGTWVGGSAEDDDPAVGVVGKWSEGVAAHVGVDGDGVGTEDLEGFTGVHFCGGPDVTPFGIENRDNVGIVLAEIFEGEEQFVDPVLPSVVGELGFKGAGKLCGCVDDRFIKSEERFCFVFKDPGDLG